MIVSVPHHIVAACAAGLLLTSPAAHASDASPWQTDSHSQIRLVAGSRSGPVMLGGIAIQLQPGWHTYWRNPGDSGVPPRFDTLSYKYLVRTRTIVTPDVPPEIYTISAPPGQVTFSIETTVGRAYRVLYSDDLSSSEWTQLGRDFVAANAYASLTDTLALPQRFYKVILLP